MPFTVRLGQPADLGNVPRMAFFRQCTEWYRSPLSTLDNPPSTGQFGLPAKPGHAFASPGTLDCPC